MGQNAIEWGNRHQFEQLVHITYRIHPDSVEVVVRDEGPGFDRSNLAHAASPENPIAHMGVREKLGLREGGFGLLITNGMVDEMRYNELGNEVTLVKRFRANGAEGG
jgi:anti-sigma regulatory factor (Ser/Thr protein kinase)